MENTNNEWQSEEGHYHAGNRTSTLWTNSDRHEAYCPAVEAYDQCVGSLSIPTQSQLDDAEQAEIALTRFVSTL